MVTLNKEELKLLKDYIDQSPTPMEWLIKTFGEKKTRKLLRVVHKIYN